jgi:hypothetical protein
MAPWKQFFDMGGSTEKPFANVRNIAFSNINVECKSLGEMEGNATDTVSNIVFRDIQAKAEKATLKTKYTGIKFENVVVNGVAFVVKE